MNPRVISFSISLLSGERGNLVKMNQKSIFNFSTLVVVAIGIGAALYGFLGFFGFTVGPATWIKPAVAFLTIFGALFGPVIGFLIGFIGHVITDLMSGGGVWWGWALGSVVEHRLHTAGASGSIPLLPTMLQSSSASSGRILPAIRKPRPAK